MVFRVAIEGWERFLTATQAEKSRLKTASTTVESFMAQGVDAIDMIVVAISTKFGYRKLYSKWGRTGRLQIGFKAKALPN